MKRLIKVLLGLAGALVLLLVLAGLLFSLTYDKEDLKAAIANEVYKQTGRELKIEGALDYSIFPWLAIDVSDLSLGNAPGFGDQPQAKIGSARAGVALMPLLKKQISIDEVTLDGLQLALTVNEQGQNNWDDLASGESKTETGDTGPGMFSSKRVAGLKVRDANVEFTDRQTGSHYRLEGFSLETGALGDSRPVPLELKALIEDVTAGNRVGIELTTIAGIDLDAEKYSLSDFELALALDAAGQQHPIRILAPQLGLDLAAQTLQLETFTLELADLRASGGLSATRILDDPAFEGMLDVAEFSPAELMQSLQMDVPATSDPDVLQRASVKTSLSGNSDQLMLDDLTLELDQSRLNGNISVRDFDRPKVGFTLAVDEIDIDRYMAPAEEGTAGSTEDVAIPKDNLQEQDIEGQLSVGTLRMAGLEFNDARVGLAIKNGKLRLHPLTAGFYGGSYSGDVALDSSGDVPVVSLDEKVDSITFQRLVADLVDSDSLSGIAKGFVRLTGQGASSNEVLGSLKGDLGLTLTEGALEGINIWYEIRRGMALYKGLPAPEPEPNRTVFSRMKMSGTANDGVVTTNELIGELPFLTLRGDGEIDLGQSQVDLGLVAEVRNSPELAKDPLASELSGKKLPLKISGPLDAPTLAVDWEALLKSEATDMLLDKLGLGAKETQPAAAEGEQEEVSTEDQLQETAKGALFELLRKKDKKKDEDKDGS